MSPAKQLLIQQVGFVILRHFFQYRIGAKHWFKNLKILIKIAHLRTYAHCFVSSNSFHGQITQKAVHQITDPENKKCSHWKFFGTNHPQNLRFLSRRGPRSLDMRLSQHYIGPKMTFWHFPNFCRKKFPGLKKEIFCTYWMNVEVLPHDFCKLQPPKLDRNVQESFWQAGKLFSAEIWKMLNVILEPM